MASNPFKSFIPFVVDYSGHGGASGQCDKLFADNEAVPEHLLSVDPTGGQWRSIGFVEVAEGNLAHDLDGAGFLLAVQFNERILPGKVRDEHLAKKIAAVTEMDGRKPSKKEYAQLRDQVEFELLPKSHIRRTVVYVLVTPENDALVFTSSAKKATDAITLVQALLNDSATTGVLDYSVKNPVLGWLNGVARADAAGDSDGFYFEALNAAVLKKAKETIRIKDVDIESNDVQKLLEDDYDVYELALARYEEGELNLSFVLTEKLVFKRVLFPDTVLSSSTDKGEDGKVAFHSLAWLVAREYRSMLKQLTSELGGKVLRAPSKDSKTAPAADEDDEL